MEGTLSQPVEFLSALYSGMLIGILYDIFRLLRAPFPEKRAINALFDLLFYAAAGILAALTLLVLTGGDVRFFLLMGIAGGVFIQQFFLSRTLRRLCSRIAQKAQKKFQKNRAAQAGNFTKTENKNKD